LAEIIRLRDLLKTRYVISTHQAGLDAALTSFLGKGVTVDLCECKLSPECAGVIRRFYGRVKFIDSANEHQNAYLEHNAKAVNENAEVREHIPIGKDIVSLMQYIKDMKEDVVYDVKHWDDSPVGMQAFVILVMLARPEIKIDVMKKAKSVFETIRQHWVYGAYEHDSYLELVGAGYGKGIIGSYSAMVKRDVVNGEVYVPGDGKMPVDIYLHTYYAIPYEFGTECLVESKEFAKLYDWAADTLEEKPVTRPTMLSYIEEGK
jgi:hypothetical protein